MDPQATWEDGRPCPRDPHLAAAVPASHNLPLGLHRGGFPPRTTELLATGDELQRVIARAVIQHELACCQ